MINTEKKMGMRGQVTAWVLVVILTAALIPLLAYSGFPTAPLLGAIVAAMALSVCGVRTQINDTLFSLAQGLTGCIIARSITLETLSGMLDHPVMILGAVFSALLFSGILGWIITLKQILPGTTGIWGISPGAATPMILMSEGFGGDIRLVALMQYLRLMLVAALASIVAGGLGLTPHVEVDPFQIFAFQPVPWPPFLQTMALVLVGLVLCRYIHFPGANLMLPFFIGTVLENIGLMTIVLPNWLMFAAYILIGWNVGLRFTKAAFVYAMHLLPHIFVSILLLFVMCAGMGLLLQVGMGIDPMTAFLATCPGGADYITLIAAASGVDMGFVLTIQTARMVLVMLVGPPLARLAAIQLQKQMNKAGKPCGTGNP